MQASITTAGEANAFLKASHVTRTRYTHQVAAAALYFLQKQAHECSDDSETFENWCKRKAEQHPQFLYWAIVLELELLLMTYVRSLRTGDFLLYIQVLGKLVPWAFALNHHNYAIWLPVHIRDMISLKEKHPTVLQQFLKGHFVVQKSNRRFSMMALDQNHEQQNQIIKAEGGAVGLTENPASLTRWMFAGPEVAKVVTEFEENVQPSIDNVNDDHHDQKKSNQKSFMMDVSSLINTMQEMGNPFSEDSQDLIALDSKQIMPKEVVDFVKGAKMIGQDQYELFVTERLERGNVAITDTIKHNKVALFGTPTEKKGSIKEQKMVALKNDCSLFSRLYTACQAKEGTLKSFSGTKTSLSHHHCLFLAN